MKIIYGITKSNFGGAQRYVYELANEAKNKGFDVSVMCGREANKDTGNLLIKKLETQNIRVISLDNLQRDISLMKEISSFFQILKNLKSEHPDVFHINSSKMGAIGAIAGRLAGIKKIIFTAHGWAFNEPRPFWQRFPIKFLSWITIVCAHKTICVSEKTKKNMGTWPFIKNKLVVIRNGAKIFELRPKTYNETLVVGSTSELHRVKGLDVLLTAWSKFKKNRQAQLVLFNDGEERKNLENMAQNLGISDSVIFKGYIDNVRSYLSEFDIFCMPSRSEGMPYALLEAGLAKLPVIASAVGGITEIIENGQNGILIEPNDAETIFSSLVLLAEDKDLRERLGTNLKASIEEEFSFENMVRETFKLYK